MGLPNALIAIIVLGVIMWAVNTYAPMATVAKQIFNVVVIIVMVLIAVSVFVPLSW